MLCNVICTVSAASVSLLRSCIETVCSDMARESELWNLYKKMNYNRKQSCIGTGKNEFTQKNMYFPSLNSDSEKIMTEWMYTVSWRKGRICKKKSQCKNVKIKYWKIARLEILFLGFFVQLIKLFTKDFQCHCFVFQFGFCFLCQLLFLFFIFCSSVSWFTVTALAPINCVLITGGMSA